MSIWTFRRARRSLARWFDGQNRRMISRRLVDLWPAAGVSVRAGDLEMRWIDDELAVDLALLAGEGVHDDSAMPFNYPGPEERRGKWLEAC